MTMEMRQDFSPEQQIILIASDVNEVKEMVKDLNGTVKEIKIWMVGDGEKAGIFETVRALKVHTHPEITEMKTQMRIFNVKISLGLGAFMTGMTIFLKFWNPPGA